MAVFHRNWNEDAKAFLKYYLWCRGSEDDKKLARSFIYYLQADSPANQWFEELPEKEKKSWASIEVLFWRKLLKQEVIGTKEITTTRDEPQSASNSSQIITQEPHHETDTNTSTQDTQNTPKGNVEHNKSHNVTIADEDWVVLTTDFSFLTKFTKIGYSMNE